MSWKNYAALSERIYRKTLANGLQVVVVPRAGFTKKLAYFVTDFGAIDLSFTLNGEQVELPMGTAHYLEHKLFDMPDFDVSARFAALGASVNAFTSYDMTAYYFLCTEHFEENLSLLLHFVSTPYFTEESVQKEQGIIGQEIGMNADNPDTRIFESLMQSMYENHPIRNPILGTVESIAKITPQVLKAAHKAFYRPENMLLCVVGDVDGEAVCRIAEETLPASQPVQVTRQTDFPEKISCQEDSIACKMDVAMPTFQLGFKCEAPQYGEEGVRQEMVADLAAELLFGESSALYLQMYQEGLIDSSFGGGFETIKNMGVLTASGDSFDAFAVRDRILAEAQRMLAEGLDEKAFHRIKRSTLGRRMRDLDSFDSLCFRTCAYHFSGYDYFDFPALYGDIQSEEVAQFIRKVVTAERCCVSVIYPNTQEV